MKDHLGQFAVVDGRACDAEEGKNGARALIQADLVILAAVIRPALLLEAAR
jgi:hypothetical protein